MTGSINSVTLSGTNVGAVVVIAMVHSFWWNNIHIIHKTIYVLLFAHNPMLVSPIYCVDQLSGCEQG